MFVVVALSLRKHTQHTGGLVMQGRIWLFSAVLACLVAAQAVAQDNGEYLPKAGDFRIGFSTEGGSGLSYTDIDGLKTTNISFGGSYFFSSNFALELGFSYAESKNRFVIFDEDEEDFLLFGKRRHKQLRPLSQCVVCKHRYRRTYPYGVQCESWWTSLFESKHIPRHKR
jgi:hypothetical protein